MNEIIAIVDDEPDILELVSLHLKKTGFNTRGFLDAKRFTSFLEDNTPDLIILDLMLPDRNGLDICKDLKKLDSSSSIPIIMLTAKSDVTDKILGLELGADDYVTKPFSPKELVARVKAVLRRQSREEDTKRIELNEKIVIDLEKYEVTVEGENIDLTNTEFKLLQLLASKKGFVLTRDTILNYLWGEEKAVIDRTVDVHIRHLRGKLGKAAHCIKNVRGVGYKLDE